jgi:nucleotide-binding universal stress UspA family protein
VTSDHRVIVVGVDDSRGGEQAVEWALDEASAHGDTVMLVHVWQFPAVAWTKYGGDALPVFGHDEIEKLAADVLARAADNARRRAPSVDIETSLLEGHPGAALVDASGGSRLLVVGSRGQGGFKGMLMGSVSSSCAHHARCPVVIVPPGTARV